MPIKITKSINGITVILIDKERASASLLPGLFEHLSQTNLMSKEKDRSFQRNKIDYAELKVKYKSLIESGICKNKAELARYLGVSRVWVTKVFQSKQKK